MEIRSLSGTSLQKTEKIQKPESPNYNSAYAKKICDSYASGLPSVIAPQASAKQIESILQTQYPWITFSFQEMDAEEIPAYAASAGGGIHLIIDDDVLEWMAEGEESFAQGLDMLKDSIAQLLKNMKENTFQAGAYIGENGETIFWSQETLPMPETAKPVEGTQSAEETPLQP